MLLWQRPRLPAGFCKRVRPHRKVVGQAVGSQQRPRFEPELWGDYKEPFSRAQHRKCAFCEVQETTYVGNVDHWRPKAKIEALPADPAEWGHELPNTSNVQGRRPVEERPLGYWWLAYSWHNWLLVCERCNTAWKKALFPIAEGSPRWDKPWPRIREEVLLLDPYGEDDPAEHLTFDRFGQIEAVAGSVKGAETIKTLGLDRESLRNKRQEKAARAFQLIDRINRAKDQHEIADACIALAEMGRQEYEHAGMIRILVQQKLGFRWSEFEQSWNTETKVAS